MDPWINLSTHVHTLTQHASAWHTSGTLGWDHQVLMN